MEKESKHPIHKIIAFGDEFSNKTQLLNAIAAKEIFEEAAYEDQSDFKSQMITIGKEVLVLVDTISLNSRTKTSTLKRKLDVFQEMKNSGASLVIIAISIAKIPVSLSSVEYLLDLLKFLSMDRVFFVLTQGDLVFLKEERDDRYVTVEEELRNLFKRKGINSGMLRVEYFDEDNKEEMRSVLVSTAQKEGICQIKLNPDYNNADLIDLFAKKQPEEEVEENKESLWTIFSRFVNTNPMLTNVNIML